MRNCERVGGLKLRASERTNKRATVGALKLRSRVASGNLNYACFKVAGARARPRNARCNARLNLIFQTPRGLALPRGLGRRRGRRARSLAREFMMLVIPRDISQSEYLRRSKAVRFGRSDPLPGSPSCCDTQSACSPRLAC